MEEQVLSLQEYIDIFENLTNIKINICDLTGYLNHTKLKLKYENSIHSCEFCNIAKSTAVGFNACMRCKIFANTKAISIGQQFSGYCIYGLYEIGLPIIENQKTVAIIYIGNIVTDRNKTKARIISISQKTKVCTDLLLNELNNACFCNDLTMYEKIAKTITEYIKYLKSILPADNAPPISWLSEQMKIYAKENFRHNVKLKTVAKFYGYNAKYAGRQFKLSQGKSFLQYINELRLSFAKKELCETDNSILEISLYCGFNNVTYFNRIFKSEFGITPKEYRKTRKLKACNSR